MLNMKVFLVPQAEKSITTALTIWKDNTFKFNMTTDDPLESRFRTIWNDLI